MRKFLFFILSLYFGIVLMGDGYFIIGMILFCFAILIPIA